MKFWQSLKFRNLPYNSASSYPLAECLFIKYSFFSIDVPRFLLFVCLIVIFSPSFSFVLFVFVFV